jgi:hypothetical protein
MKYQQAEDAIPIIDAKARASNLSPLSSRANRDCLNIHPWSRIICHPSDRISLVFAHHFPGPLALSQMHH